MKKANIDKLLHRILKTCGITLIYCMLWIVLEQIIYGQATERVVDEIIMLLFIPVIWKATEIF